MEVPLQPQLKPRLLPAFTPQQGIILELSAKGLSNREIGTQLGIVEKTVKFHKTIIYKKLNVSTILQAIVVYNQRTTANTITISGKGSGRQSLKDKVIKLSQVNAEQVVELQRLKYAHKNLILKYATVTAELALSRKAVTALTPKRVKQSKPLELPVGAGAANART